MIIFGTRGVNSTLNQGSFYCPQCRTNRHYKHKKITQFFTLYFIPLIPIQKKGEYVECQTCKGTFVTAVLQDRGPQQSQKEFLSEYQKAIKKVLIMMMLADGEIDPREKESIISILNHTTGIEMTMEELDQEIGIVQLEQVDVETYLKSVSGALNDQGKNLIIKAGVMVADADGIIHPSELDMLKRLAKALELSSDELGTIMDQVLNPQN